VAASLMMLAELWTDTDHDEALGANHVALAELVNIQDRKSVIDRLRTCT
jgi:hypothetical protein